MTTTLGQDYQGRKRNYGITPDGKEQLQFLSKEDAHEVISRLLDEKVIEDTTSLRNKTTIIWIAILAVLASPVAFPILLFFLAMLMTLLMIIFAVMVTALALTLVLLISGVHTFFTSFSLLSCFTSFNTVWTRFRTIDVLGSTFTIFDFI